MTRQRWQKYWESIQSEQELGEDDAYEEYLADQSLDVPETDPDVTRVNEFSMAWQKSLPGYKCVLQHEVMDWGGYMKTGWFLLVDFDSEYAIIARYDEKLLLQQSVRHGLQRAYVARSSQNASFYGRATCGP